MSYAKLKDLNDALPDHEVYKIGRKPLHSGGNYLIRRIELKNLLMKVTINPKALHSKIEKLAREEDFTAQPDGVYGAEISFLYDNIGNKTLLLLPTVEDILKAIEEYKPQANKRYASYKKRQVVGNFTNTMNQVKYDQHIKKNTHSYTENKISVVIGDKVWSINKDNWRNKDCFRIYKNNLDQCVKRFEDRLNQVIEHKTLGGEYGIEPRGFPNILVRNTPTVGLSLKKTTRPI